MHWPGAIASELHMLDLFPRRAYVLLTFVISLTLGEHYRCDKHSRKRHDQQCELFQSAQHRRIAQEREACQAKQKMYAKDLQGRLTQQHQWPYRRMLCDRLRDY